MKRFVYHAKYATKGGNPGERRGTITARSIEEARNTLVKRANMAGRSKVDIWIAEVAS